MSIPSMKDTRDIVRGAQAMLAGVSGRVVARVILLVAAGHLFGAGEVGFLGQVAAGVEILAAIGSMGLRRSLLGFLSEDQRNGDAVETRIVSALLVALIMGLVLTLILAFAWPLAFGPDREMPMVLFFAIPAIVFGDVALAATRFRRVVRWEVLARCVVDPWSFLVFTLLMYALGEVAGGLVIAYGLSLIAASITALWGLHQVFGLGRLWRNGFDWQQLLVIPRKSLPIGITDIGTMMFRRIDILILAVFVGPAETGIYYMVMQIATVPHKVHTLFEPMIGPVIAKLHQDSELTTIEAKLSSVCRWVFAIQLSVTVPVAVFGTQVLGLFGPEFAAGAIVLAVILVAELLDGSFALVETPLVFAHPRTLPKLIVATLIIECASIAILAAFFGALGAAIGFAIAMSFLTIARLAVARKSLGIRVLNKSFIPPFVLAAGAVIGLLSISRAGVLTTPYEFGFVILAGVVGYMLIYSRIGLTAEDRTILRRLKILPK